MRAIRPKSVPSGSSATRSSMTTTCARSSPPARAPGWNFLSSTDVYDPDIVALDRDRLRQHYLEHGYVDFRVVSAVAELTRDREDFFITFTVEEGSSTVSATSI